MPAAFSGSDKGDWSGGPLRASAQSSLAQRRRKTCCSDGQSSSNPKTSPSVKRDRLEEKLDGALTHIAVDGPLGFLAVEVTPHQERARTKNEVVHSDLHQWLRPSVSFPPKKSTPGKSADRTPASIDLLEHVLGLHVIPGVHQISDLSHDRPHLSRSAKPTQRLGRILSRSLGRRAL